MNATYRYPAAALAASLVFGLLELNAMWAAGPEHLQMRHPVAMLAQALASQFTPAASLLRAGSDRRWLTFWLMLATQALLTAGFVGLLWWCIRPGLPRRRWLDTALLAAQMLAVVALDSVAFHLILATELAALLPLRRALAWVAALFALGLGVDIATLASVRAQMNDSLLLTMLATLTFERSVLLLGVAFAWLARQEQDGRTRLAASHAQLRATQSLLADTVRTSERMRIARDLHDAVGHHLTALNLHLDLATRQSQGTAPAALNTLNTTLNTAHELSRSLLAEVRGVVSAERSEPAVHLRQALALLCAGIPAPIIALRVDSGADACSPAAAHTLLCCVQEAITNTVRHAGAARLSIEIGGDDGGVTARIADDGNGSGNAAEGNGLTGMRERLAAHGGTLRVGNGARGATGATVALAAACGSGGSGGTDGNGGTGGNDGDGRLRGYWLELSLPFAGARP